MISFKMQPILFQIGSFKIYSLGLVVGLGFFGAFFLCWRRLKEAGINEEKAVDAFLFSALTGLVFSRGFQIVLNFDDFGFNLGRWLFLGRFPGLSFWGAIFGFFWGFAWMAKKEKWNFFRLADELVFGLAVFAALIHLGAFLDGSFLGAETGMFWGVFFPGDLVRRQPVGIFYFFLFVLLWGWLLRIERRWRIWEWYKSKKEGFLFLTFLIGSGLIYFLLAFLKPAGLYSTLREKVVSSLFLLLTGGFLYFRSGKKLTKDWGGKKVFVQNFKKKDLKVKVKKKDGQKISD